MNQACLDKFGQAFTFRRNLAGESQSITGILESAAELEDVAPGEGSMYARLWIKQGDIVPAPQPGDEIESATTIYKIVRLEMDAASGLDMLLRQDRTV